MFDAIHGNSACGIGIPIDQLALEFRTAMDLPFVLISAWSLPLPPLRVLYRYLH